MLVSDLLRDIKRYLEPDDKRDPSHDPDDPDAPFAMIGAPLKPRPPLCHSSIAVQPER